MLSKPVTFVRKLAGKFSQHRDSIFFVYIVLLALTLPAFYPDPISAQISTHNGVLLGLGLLGWITLIILDATALDDGDLLDKLADSWVDLPEDGQKLVVDFANNLLKEIQDSNKLPQK